MNSTCESLFSDLQTAGQALVRGRYELDNSLRKVPYRLSLGKVAF